MNKDRLSVLGAKLLGQPPMNRMDALVKAEKLVGFEFWGIHRDILIEYGTAITFENDVVFRPLTKTPLDRKDGSHSLEILYGLGDENNSIPIVYQDYLGGMPCSVCPIGSLPGGNQLCLCHAGLHEGKVFLWDHENELEIQNDEHEDFKNMYLVAESFEDFFKGLEVRAEPPPKKRLGIIWEESSLDF